MHRKSLLIRPPAKGTPAGEQRLWGCRAMVQAAGPFGRVFFPSAKQRAPRRGSRRRRRQVTFRQLMLEDALRDRDKGALVGGNLQELGIGHGRVIGAKGLLLSSHEMPPGSSAAPETERASRSARITAPRKIRNRVMPAPFQIPISDFVLARRGGVVKARRLEFRM